MTASLDPRLAEIADSLERTRWGAELWDSEWRLAYVSNESKAGLGDGDDEELGVGKHALEARWNPAWYATVDDASRQQLVEYELPYIAWDTPGGAERVRELFERTTGLPAPEVEPKRPPAVWSNTITL